MKFKITLLTFGLTALAATGVEAGEVLGTVGTHSVRLVEAGKAQRLVSIPYLRVPSARGRLDGVDPVGKQLIDHDQGFTGLDPASSYIALIGDGTQAGHWFLVNSDSTDPSAGLVELDGLAGELSLLTGNEIFTVHRLFTLAELFGNDGGMLQAGPDSRSSTKLNFYRGSSYEEYWLSDGTSASAGWTFTRNGVHEPVGHSAILPGMSFFLSHPNPTETVDIRVQGAVVKGPVHLPLLRGYNFVAPVQSQTLVDAEGMNLNLNHLGLRESGFLEAASFGSGDKLLIFDNARSKMVDTLYLDAVTQEFRSLSFGSTDSPVYEMLMGEGMILLNTQGAYTWRFPGE